MDGYQQLLNTYNITNCDMYFEETNELTQCAWYFKFENTQDCVNSGNRFYDTIADENNHKRESIEQNYYNFITNGLKHKIGEIDYSSNVNIDNRRIVFTNDDCISFIQFMIRDEINLNVHLRSSDFENALPSDIKFFCKLQNDLINFLINEFSQNTKKKENINILNNIKNKEIKMFITFGSLHKRSDN